MFGKGWIHHPATEMWRGHPGALVRYGLDICEEWILRGYADTVGGKLDQVADVHGLNVLRDPDPWWWGTEAFHLTHRSALLRKNSAYYGARFPAATPPDLEYLWPTSQEGHWRISGPGLRRINTGELQDPRVLL